MVDTTNHFAAFRVSKYSGYQFHHQCGLSCRVRRLHSATPISLMMILLLVGGFFRSLQFTSIIRSLTADVDLNRISRATALVSVAQQLAISAGVAIGADGGELAV